ncbi:SseB family protein [Ponticoccus sp. SC2-23]|uniref:SseB family protein n=1 Tax=Alexandriicola marinus TaxID=2081710 RepID=UPI000FDBA449|nr:SseB family protein [Alexandriicola marinus]MBM1219732.1 SseB family protein [Ponticoccus sp. SC6-9]MBM1223196.1 SseB family protein [Ponticoccus sp. SC6-15]MBM1229545.1 SseB family protein [Ponticoccus sp. SC6-38]MBM1232162.1 SseB family protein [Ponticoccus sp. SC6-45]MBM1237888.1 SseB family protein [Ponticoccus sp. SC6-49]MBM1241173.1 SseB family protein [Ponticoccus sp. SC2-64]MBM1245686.1 SseB family protein [Ponticoccus sp. SC6-42]MBM1250164.1 SseB family protein [Ponticoccus sp. 
MTDPFSEIDRAHAAMAADEADDALRLAFFGVFADAPLVILLEDEAAEDSVSPRVIEVSGVPYVLAFDSDERLAEYAGEIAPYAGLSGRGLAELLDGQGVGIALNLTVAPSEYLVPPDAVSWLTQTLAHAPDQAEARPVAVRAPADLPAPLATSLARKLDGTGDLAQAAWLVVAEYSDGQHGSLLVFVGAEEAAQPALAVAVSEALAFSGLEAGALDVTFADADSALAERVARVGRAVELPRRPVVETAPVAPGMDPDKPPRLR